MFLKKPFALILLFLSLYARSYAQGVRFLPDELEQNYSSAALANTGTYPLTLAPVEGNKWNDLVAGVTSFTIKSVDDIIRVGINHDTGLAVAAFDYDIDISLKGFLPSAPTVAVGLAPVTLHLSYDPETAIMYHDQDVYKFTGYHRVIAAVTDIRIHNTTTHIAASAVPRNFYIKSQVVTQSYDIAATLPRIVPVATITGRMLQLSWQLYRSSGSSATICATPNVLDLMAAFKPAVYDVEWTYIDDYHFNLTNNTDNTPFTAGTSLAYDFRKNATRIRVSGTTCNIPLVYDRGTIVYRIRMVRPKADDYGELVYSDWTMPDQGFTDGSCANRHYVRIFSGETMNWQYTASFAEDGKYKHVINYFDGTLKERQTQTKLNTDPTYIVAVDKVYDYEGRPGVVSLPTPIQQADLQYTNTVLRKSTGGAVYTAADIDGFPACSVPNAVNPVATTAQAGKYYSSANPDQAGMQQYVPDANGYPLVQTVYSPDNTNKVQFQGGAGAALQPSGGHSTQYEYIRANQAEMDQLLGTEAGYQQYYPKQVTTDPNGQSSFSIMDPAGKIVISGLQGANPGRGGAPLDSLPNYIQSTQVCNDLLSGVIQETNADNKTAFTTVYTDAAGTAGTSYNISYQPYYTGCAGKYLWAQASYDVSVTNDCGTAIAGLGRTATIGEVKETTTNGTTTANFGPLSTTLDKGKYLVNKKVAFSAFDIRKQIETFIQTNTPACYTDVFNFIHQAVDATTFDCPPSGVNDPANDPAMGCAALKEQMIKDMYPGARYGRYIGANSNTFISDTANSIFSLLITPTPGLIAGTTEYRQGETDPCAIHCSTSTATCSDGRDGCGCGVGAHSYPSYCCSACLVNHCACIKFQYAKKTVTTTAPVTTTGPCHGPVKDYAQYWSLPGPGAPGIETGRETRWGQSLYWVKLYNIWHCDCGYMDTSSEFHYHIYPIVITPSGAEEGDIYAIRYSPDPTMATHTARWGTHSCPHTEMVTTTATVLMPAFDIRYRYQADCIIYPSPYTANGVTYDDVKSLPPDEFIKVFDEELAEALVQLHPEYCHYLQCTIDNDTFEHTLRSITTAQQAIDLGRFTLDGMYNHDPLVSVGLESSLKWVYPHNADLQYRLDTIAAKMAYCNAGNPTELDQCARNVFRNDIRGAAASTGSGFLNDAVRQRYFEILRDLYLANRSVVLQYYLAQRFTTAASCGLCPDIQLQQSGSFDYASLYPRHSSADGVPVTDPGLVAKMPSWLQDLFSSTVASYGSPLTSTTIPAEVQAGYDQAQTDKIAAQADGIMKQLANATLDGPTLASLRSQVVSLLTYDINGLTPVGIDNILSTASGHNDLAHAFLVNYRSVLTAPSPAAPTFACGDAAKYTSLGDFLKKTVVLNALSNPGTTYSYTPGSGFEQPLTDETGITSITASMDGKTSILGFSDFNQYKVFITPQDNATGVDFKTSVAAGYIPASITVGCINDDPKANISGEVAKYTATIDMVKLGVSGGYRRYYVWSNFSVLMNTLGDPKSLSNCVLCTDIKLYLDSFRIEKTTYGYSDATNHPLYTTTLTNYLNYKLKKNYKYADYERLMKGCAVTDRMSLPKLQTYARVVLNNDASVTALNSIMNSWASGLRPAYFRYKNAAGNPVLLFGFNDMPQDQLLQVKTNLTAATAVLTPGSILERTYLPAPDGTSMLFLPSGCSGFTPASYGATATTESAAIWEGAGYNTGYTRYTLSRSGTAKDQADMVANIDAYLHGTETCAGGYYRYGYDVLRSDDYGTTPKSTYLDYIFTGAGSTRVAILSNIDSLSIGSHISGYTTYLWSYTNPYCTGKRNDLFAYQLSPTVTSGYKRLTDTIIGWTNTAHKLFPSAAYSVVTGPTRLTVTRKGNGDYWYRYFDPANHMYNLYVTPPAVTSGDRNTYTVTAIQAGPHPNTFVLQLSSGSATPATTSCMGYADFTLHGAQVLHDVVLYEDPNGVTWRDTADCEKLLLDNAVLNGQAAYQHYFDSTATAMSGSMMKSLLGSVQETLTFCGQQQQYQYTLYYYDLAGNLTRTVPPAGISGLSGALSLVNTRRDTNTVSGDRVIKMTSNNKVSSYRYNALNLLTTQQTPDGGLTEMFYDAAGRLSFSQNAQQRDRGAYTYNLYDAQGRPAETGELIASCMVLGYGCFSYADPDGGPVIISRHPSFIYNSFNEGLYNNDALAAAVHGYTRTEVVRTVYDAETENLGLLPDSSFSRQEHLRSRVAAILYYPSAAPFSGTPVWPATPQFASYFSYDVTGNVKTVGYFYAPLSALGQSRHRVDYDYDLVSGKVNMISYNHGRADQFFQRYDYDADNRITEVNTSNDGLIWNKDARYTYYKHGPLATQRIGTHMIQSLEYAYTIQGWLKAINGDVQNATKEMGRNGIGGDRSYARDVVAHSLSYFVNDYQPINGSPTDNKVVYLPQPAVSLYNGNIVQQATSIGSLGGMQRSYRYDQLQRLKLATNKNIDATTGGLATTPAQLYQSSYAYDKDGNITQLSRYNGVSSPVLIDNFTYNYSGSGGAATTNNRLQQVSDAAAPTTAGADLQPGQGSSNYSYDASGNLVQDQQGNLKIQWDHFGKVKSISDDVNKKVIQFFYDGKGNRIWKDISTYSGGPNEERQGEYYVYDAGGKLLTTYRSHSLYDRRSVISVYNTSFTAATSPGTLTGVLTDLAGTTSLGSLLRGTALSNHAGWVDTYTDQPVSYYTGHGLTTVDALLYADNTWIDAMRTRDMMEGTGVLRTALLQSGMDLSTLFVDALPYPIEGKELLQKFDQIFPSAVTTPIWSFFGQQHTPNPMTNATNMSNWLQTHMPMQQQMADKMANTVMNSNMSAGPEATAFCDAIVSDNTLMQSSILMGQGGNWTSDLQMLVSNNGDPGQLAAFYDSWPNAKSILDQVTSPGDRLNIIYMGNTTGVLTDILGQLTATEVAGSIADMPEISTAQYGILLDGKAAGLGLDVIKTVLGLGKDTLQLSEHHLYGSSHLGVQQYDTSGISMAGRATGYSSFQFGGTNTWGLSRRQPWYSYTYGQLIDSMKKTASGTTINNDLTTFTTGRILGRKEYELTDHLGNVLATVLDRKTGASSNGSAPALGSLFDHWNADIASSTDYYPGGMPMPGRTTEYRWSRMGSQGQVKDDEIYGKGNAYAFKYRMEDTRINRFWSEDPLAKKYPFWTPYAFSGNRLIDARELEGLEIFFPLLGAADIIEPEIGMVSESEILPRPMIHPEIVELSGESAEVGLGRGGAIEKAIKQSFSEEALEHFSRGRSTEAQQLKKMGVEKNYKPLPPQQINGEEVTSVPDAFGKGGTQTIEVKDVKYQGYTKQLKAQEKFSNGNGENPILRINKGARISRPLQNSTYEIQTYGVGSGTLAPLKFIGNTNVREENNTKATSKPFIAPLIEQPK